MTSTFHHHKYISQNLDQEPPKISNKKIQIKTNKKPQIQTTTKFMSESFDWQHRHGNTAETALNGILT